jgi:hypothetical protein
VRRLHESVDALTARLNEIDACMWLVKDHVGARAWRDLETRKRALEAQHRKGCEREGVTP